MGPMRLPTLFLTLALLSCGDTSDAVPTSTTGGAGTAGTGGSFASGTGGGAGASAPTGGARGGAGSGESSDSGAATPSTDAASLGETGAPASDSATPGNGKDGIVPKSGLLFGAYVDGGQVVPRETLLGRKLSIHHRFYAWSDNWVDANLADDVSSGRIPMSTWEPHTAPLTDISAGKFDAMAHAVAQAAKAVQKPIFLRFAHEMNGDWYEWGGAKNGNDATAPQKYVAAWKHLHDLFVGDGASNVLWIWCPNIGGAPNAAWNQPSAYYPGDAYVDWVAVDGYNWGNSQSWSKWTAFKDILGQVYASYAAMGKPLMIAETGSVEGGGDKAMWVNDLRGDLKTTFPAVKALVYFDTFDAINKADWKIDTSQASLAAFVAMGKDAYFNP
jgi:hypothetical protein